ncbi:hypothetical protein ABZ464_30245 [Streptomyces sp. NPDC005820]|uniref:hypothetical protein n=1 Tax=Streptomyces sp. NPDC005820 TaxID=3157069 RepID=UPI0033F876A2
MGRLAGIAGGCRGERPGVPGLGGATVKVFDGYRPVAEIDAGNRKWTIEELTAAAPALFRDRDPGVPETPGLGPIPFPTLEQA